jgi:hypothetical protein
MRKFWLSAILILGSSSLTFSQTSPNDPGAASTPGTAPAAQDPAHPQNQMPPDGKAPAPTAGAKTSSDSSASQASPAQSAEPRYLLAGTDIRAALDTPLSTRTSKVGDRFTATLVAPVHDSSGNVVIPVGAKLNGQISEPTNEKLEGAIKDMGHLNLRFTDTQLADGSDIPLSAVLISIHNGKPATSATLGNTHPAQPGSNAIAGNPGSVASLGRPIKGVAVGNLAGGGYVLSTTSKQVELPAESILRLRVDRNTPIP